MPDADISATAITIPRRWAAFHQPDISEFSSLATPDISQASSSPVIRHESLECFLRLFSQRPSNIYSHTPDDAFIASVIDSHSFSSSPSFR